MRYTQKTSLFLSMMTCCLFQFLRGQFESSATVEDWALQNHVFTSINFTTLMGCFLECTRVLQCYSLNFHPSNGLCELSKATNISHPKDFRAVKNALYLGYRTMTTCGDLQCATGKRCFITQGQKSECKSCEIALGMQDGRIRDSDIKSSSNFLLDISRKNEARLHLRDKSWAPVLPIVGEWLQVDLVRVTAVTMVTTQGRTSLLGFSWITKYKITTSMDEQAWDDYKENGVVKFFNGNVNSEGVVTNSFKEKLVARYVRVVVQAWNVYPDLRMELYGCLA